MKLERTYLNFARITENGSTSETFLILAKSRTNEELGRIYWFSRWKKYIFAPLDLTVFDSKCLHEIGDFLEEIPRALGTPLMKDRK